MAEAKEGLAAALPQNPRILFALAIVAAALQVGFASQWNGREEYFGALTVGWAVAIAVAYGHRARIHERASRIERLAGAALYLAALVVAVAGCRGYHGVDRILPGVTGLGLVICYSGLRHARDFGRELVLLSVTVIHPLPTVIRDAVMPTQHTASLASLYLRTFGFPVERDGTVLLVPSSSLTVLDACSGLTVIGQLLVLAILVLCLFPMRSYQKLIVMGGAIAVGFTVNAARIAWLAVMASRVPNDIRYFRRYEAASAVFPVIAVAVAGLVWWIVLRAPREYAPGARPPG